ncbi:Uncharacterized protein Adt_06331 [Abeliophyllum distichum]|uniref:Uncharacterized protein n=1 Tax=Abeliophyllum distichum TaxID=126358 RepID=A0ABD1V6L6_9LAMI
MGRPFLATIRPLIDVEKCELILKVQDDERALFSMYIVPKQLVDLEGCFRVDEVVKIGQEMYKSDVKIGGLIGAIKDENDQFKIWRARNKSCKAGNCKKCKTSKARFEPP